MRIFTGNLAQKNVFFFKLKYSLKHFLLKTVKNWKEQLSIQVHLDSSSIAKHVSSQT